MDQGGGVSGLKCDVRQLVQSPMCVYVCVCVCFCACVCASTKAEVKGEDEERHVVGFPPPPPLRVYRHQQLQY